MTNSSITNLKIKLFADGADLAGIKEMYQNPFIKGFTTNPTLMRKADIQVALNVTALTTLEQVKSVTKQLSLNVPAIISVFAGRIADTGRDPVPLMAEAVKVMSDKPQSELIWASPRELLNIFQAESVGCHIITATNDILKKLTLVDKDLDQYSLETVQMFFKDAQAAGYKISISG